MVESRRLYKHKKKGNIVYVNGRVKLLPENVPLVVFILTENGEGRAAQEDVFLNAYELFEN